MLQQNPETFALYFPSFHQNIEELNTYAKSLTSGIDNITSIHPWWGMRTNVTLQLGKHGCVPSPLSLAGKLAKVQWWQYSALSSLEWVRHTCSVLVFQMVSSLTLDHVGHYSTERSIHGSRTGSLLGALWSASNFLWVWCHWGRAKFKV